MNYSLPKLLSLFDILVILVKIQNTVSILILVTFTGSIDFKVIRTTDEETEINQA